jgi:4,5:9,10-diseco-3-hydroxy-5,9,17-trioxoandrosta-1(10),2-diene-4-oate hydrolase
MSSPRPQDQYVTVGSVKTRFWSQGDHGSPVVLIHGISGSADDWIENIGVLARDHRVYAMDLVGFGRCDMGGPDVSLEGMTDFVRRFMQTQSVETAGIVGHSLGGRLAIHFAAEFPEMTKHLVLVASSGLGRGVPLSLRLSSIAHVGEVLWRPSRSAVGFGLKGIVYDPAVITREMVDASYQCAARPGSGRSFLSVLRTGVSWRGQRESFVRSTRDDLSRIAAPTLVIWGRQDRVLTPAHAQVVAEMVPNTKLVFFDRCGHLPQLERPNEFNSELLSFLAE